MQQRGCITLLDNSNMQAFLDFASRSAELIGHFFSKDSILAQRLPHIYGPNCMFSYLYKLYGASFAGLLLSGQLSTFAVSVGGFVFNAVAVGASLGLYGGLTKLASIPHMVALGYPAWVVWNDLQLVSMTASPVTWLSCVAALAFYIPALVGDVGELYQVFVQGKYYVLMPDGVVHPLKTWTTPDSSVKLDMSVMFMTAVPPKP